MAFAGPTRRSTEGQPASRRIDQLLYRIRGLRAIGTVLHVGTHPDDEDAGLMAFVARKYGARIVYWSATRGEAGQNRLGSYAGAALGIYRTWESLAARAIDGGESMFGPFYDFGYTTSGADATSRWGSHELVREVVRAIRLVQPQVIVARFVGSFADGHGQHQATGAATVEAFEAAADPARFPELGLPAWRTAKLYQSTGGDWQAGEHHSLGARRPELECDGVLRLDTGEHDPVVGLTYQHTASLAFNCHQTQAMGFVPNPDSFYYYYRLKASRVRTTPHEESFYDGLDPTLPGLVTYPGEGPQDLAHRLDTVCACVDAALHQLRPDDASAAAAPLLEGLDTLRWLRADVERHQAIARQLDDKIAAFEDVILGCLGVDAECIAERTHVAAGERVRIRGRLLNPRGVLLDETRLTISVPPGWTSATVSADEPGQQAEYDVGVSPAACPTVPSWLREPNDGYRYAVGIDTFACEALDAPPVVLEGELRVGSHRLTLRRPALRRESFPGGYRELLLSVIPAVSVSPQLRMIVLPAGGDDCEVDLQAAVHRHVGQDAGAGHLQVAIPEGWKVVPASVECLADTSDVIASRFRVTVPGGLAAGRYRLQYLLGSPEARPAVTLEPVWMGPPGLLRAPDAGTCTREAFLTRPAQVDVHIMGATFARGLTYGYVRGAAEGVLDGLEHFGLNIRVVGDDEMSYLELVDFDAIVVGPNAYLLRQELRRNAGRFLDYVARGGTLIVQYQAYGYEMHGFAPYPFDYSHPHDRVTSPDAPVIVLEPQHPLMTRPNRITEDDFTGWIHDRGLYFFGEFDDRYTPILGCCDPGQTLKRGGLVVASYGRGAFVYVGYSVFRQIPAAVPGAFRLLANLLALPEALLLERVDRLRALSLFSFMTDEQLIAVARIVSERQEIPGTYLCRQGELGRELFIIVKGDVEVVKHTASGPVVITTAREGQVVGEFAILADVPRTADLRAASHVLLLGISGVDFRALIRRHTEIAENIIRQLVMKLVAE